MPSLYELLGVSKDASDDEIKKAWRRKALTEHPDKGGDKEKFQEAQEANRILSDERLRRIYDQTGQIPNDDGAPQSGGPDLSHIFGQMFGSGGGFPFPGFPGMGGPPPPGQKLPRGPNKHHEIGLSHKDFYKGRSINIRMTRDILCGNCKGKGGSRPENCGACGGRGVRIQQMQMGPMITVNHTPCRVCNQTGQVCAEKCGPCGGKCTTPSDMNIEARIEPGMQEGDRLTFPRQCSESPQYDEPGDFILVLRYSNSDNCGWIREGNNLRRDVEISLGESMLGFERKFNEHPSEREIRIAWNTGPLFDGELLRMKGWGMPIRGSNEHGDALITVKIRREQRTWSEVDSSSLKSVWSDLKDIASNAEDMRIERV
jgi:DnaJ family protein A protein 2